MTTTNDWIKMSERKPTEADLPVWFCRDDWEGTGMKRPVFVNRHSDYSSGETKHGLWRKADIPAPPKEQTQRDRDEAAYMAWFKDPSSGNTSASPRCWHAALAWERAEIAKLISETVPAAWSKEPSHYFPESVMDKLRARLRP